MAFAWDVFRKIDGKPTCIAKLRYADDAAALAGINGPGTVVKHWNRIVWREGAERFSGSESYDGAARVMIDRANQHQRERLAKHDALYGTHLNQGDK